MQTAFNNDQKLKDKYVKRVQSHYDADEIVQGIYWENGKGCAVGCTLEYDNSGASIHQRMEDELGIPRMLARLEDRIFEGLKNGEAKEFPLRFLKAIQLGADLSMVVPKFFVWLLVDPTDGVIKFARPDGKKAIQHVADLYQQKIEGKTITEKQWRAAAAAAYAYAAAAYAYAAAADAADAAYAYAAAADAADAAYAYAAAAYAYADAADAAYAYAYAADAAAADAAYAYAADADAYAADAADGRKLHYKKMADKLVELLEAEHAR